MKTILATSAAAAVLVFAGSALAQPVYDWSGLYVGATAGGGFGDEHWQQTASSLALPLDHAIDKVNTNGGVYGGQIGYNFPTTSRWVFGVEGQLLGSHLDGADGHVVFPQYGGESNITWVGSITGRVGYNFNPALLYARAGGAFAHEEHVITFNGAQTSDIPSETRSGWLAGVGLEVPLGRDSGWSGRIEYDYMDLGTKNVHFLYTANPAGLTEDWDLETREQMVTASINYRFR